MLKHSIVISLMVLSTGCCLIAPRSETCRGKLADSAIDAFNDIIKKKTETITQTKRIQDYIFDNISTTGQKGKIYSLRQIYDPTKDAGNVYNNYIAETVNTAAYSETVVKRNANELSVNLAKIDQFEKALITTPAKQLDTSIATLLTMTDKQTQDAAVIIGDLLITATIKMLEANKKLVDYNDEVNRQRIKDALKDYTWPDWAAVEVKKPGK